LGVTLNRRWFARADPIASGTFDLQALCTDVSVLYGVCAAFAPAKQGGETTACANARFVFT
jgi:hypothetical protein